MVGDADAVRRLLDLGFAVDSCDAQGCTALLRAAGGGHRTTLDLLIEHGADPYLRDALNRTPREIAVMRGFVDVAVEFNPAVPGASMARFLREPR